ncbi:hypothetical protein C2S53_017003 [Perilla frutescens var. hirtella]|uniref:Ubiquitin-like domain-containing protein n=1 Tax=Perilla frutescens var. hirtella TaxID=608512 RepID=A0AAD4JIV1_PERFH|nr:hypothetical protein C2S53_017003 [Perilla frutescens var. hirtella]
MASESPADATDDRIRVMMESPTADYYIVLKETSKVEVLMESVRKRWGPEYFTLHHGSQLMESHKKLTAYNVRDGSVIKVSYFAEFP